MPTLKYERNKIQNNDSLFIQNIPSSFHINPDFFNSRVVRIKQKIDKIISEYTLSTQPDDKSVTRSGSSNYSNYRITTFQQISIQKFDLKLIDYVRNIYKEIYQLRANVNKDQDQVQTNTFQLRSFLKDLQNQQKRLVRVIPEMIMAEIQCDKKKPVLKSQIEKIQEKQQDKVVSQKVEEQNIQEEKIDKIAQQKRQEKAKQQIQQNFHKRRIFNQKQKFFQDEQTQCKGCYIF